MISRASECEWTVGAPQGASLCTRIKRKPRGSNEWLRARTKRGAGSARRAGIQILRGEMTPLSAGYIAGGSNRPSWEFGVLAPEKSSDREDPGFDTHHGLTTLHSDCSDPPPNMSRWNILPRRAEPGSVYTSGSTRGANFTRGHAAGAVRGAGGALAGEHHASSGG